MKAHPHFHTLLISALGGGVSFTPAGLPPESIGTPYKRLDGPQGPSGHYEAKNRLPLQRI
jgi:hypothetical protein